MPTPRALIRKLAQKYIGKFAEWFRKHGKEGLWGPK